MLYIQTFVFNSFSENTYVIYDQSQTCAIIDPGCYAPEEQKALSDFIQQHNLKVTHLINTHGHIDHVLGNQYVKDTYGVELALHEQEIPTLQAATTYAPVYSIMDYVPVEIDTWLREGDIIQVGATTLQVLHVPGHSPGHIALYSAQDRLCLAGDVLFQGSIGRTDLPCGDHPTLLQSIYQKLFPLGDDVVIYPGHGPTTTLGEEKRNNPYLIKKKV